MSQVSNDVSNQVYWTAGSVNAWGKAESYTFGNGVTTYNTYEAQTGRLTNIRAGKTAAYEVASQDYEWDSLNNLTRRIDKIGVKDAAGVTVEVADVLSYDRLNRLTNYKVQGKFSDGTLERPVDLVYDFIGNILAKTDVGYYTYNSAGANGVRPHAASAVAGVNYGYDANGNMVSASGGKWKEIGYTSFNLPDATRGILGANGTRYTYNYDEEHKRIKETRVSSAGTRVTYSLHPDAANGLSFEQEFAENGTITNRHYISAGGMSIAVLTTNGEHGNAAATTVVSTQYWHKDHLGSVIAATDAAGNLIGRYNYDPFGKRRNISGQYDQFGTLVIDWGLTGAGAGPDRGFTGHEHLDDIGIIHMNGRLYDPNIARMMQADPVIAGLEDLQYFNRYSYVFNRPTVLVDANGNCPFCYVLLFSAVGARALGLIDTKTFRMVVGIAVSFYLGPQGGLWAAGGGWAGFMQAVVAGFAGGVVSTGTLKGGITSAFSAGVFYGAGTLAGADYLGAAEGTLGHAAIHGVAGCITSVAGGGKCGQGAIAAAFGDYFGAKVTTNNIVANLVIRSVIGGVSSVLGGGKFASGAQTAAYGYLFNCLSHEGACTKEDIPEIKKAMGECSNMMCVKQVADYAREAGMAVPPDLGQAVKEFLTAGVAGGATAATAATLAGGRLLFTTGESFSTMLKVELTAYMEMTGGARLIGPLFRSGSLSGLEGAQAVLASNATVIPPGLTLGVISAYRELAMLASSAPVQQLRLQIIDRALLLMR